MLAFVGTRYAAHSRVAHLLDTAKAKKKRGRQGMTQTRGISRTGKPADTTNSGRSDAALRWLPIHGPSPKTVAPKVAGSSQTLIEQNCARCTQQVNCWGVGDESLVLVNLLICRIKFGTKKDHAAAVFLERIRPKIVDLSEHVSRQLNGKRPRAEIEQYLSDQAIYHILRKYQVEAVAYPLQFLFGPFGAVFFDAHGIVKRWIGGEKLETVGTRSSGDFEADTAESRAGRTDPDLMRAAGLHDTDSHAMATPDEMYSTREREDTARSTWRAMMRQLGLTAREERILRFMLWLQSEFSTAMTKKMVQDFAEAALGITVTALEAQTAKLLARARAEIDIAHLRTLGVRRKD